MTRHTLIGTAFVALVLGLYSSVPAAAVSEAVREACTGDAHQFCESVISDVGKRRACMRKHFHELSKGCVSAIKKSKS